MKVRYTNSGMVGALCCEKAYILQNLLDVYEHPGDVLSRTEATISVYINVTNVLTWSQLQVWFTSRRRKTFLHPLATQINQQIGYSQIPRTMFCKNMLQIYN